MAKLEEVTTILDYPERYGGLSQVKISIPLESRIVALKKEMTGLNKEQYFETEMDHTWVPFRFEGKLYLASRELSMEVLKLNGKNGYLSNGYCQRTIAELYDNEKMGIKGVAFAKEMFENLPVFLKEKLGRCWTATSYNKISRELGYYIIQNGMVCRSMLATFDWCSGKINQKWVMARMQLIVEIPSDSMVDVHVSAGKTFQLYTKESYIMTKDEMQALVQLAKKRGDKEILSLLSQIKDRQ